MRVTRPPAHAKGRVRSALSYLALGLLQGCTHFAGSVYETSVVTAKDLDGALYVAPQFRRSLAARLGEGRSKPRRHSIPVLLAYMFRDKFLGRA